MLLSAMPTVTQVARHRRLFSRQTHHCAPCLCGWTVTGKWSTGTINVNGESISAYHGQIHKFGMREYVLNAWRDVCLTAQQPLRAATSDIFSDRSHPLTFTAEPTSLKSHTPCRTHPHSLLYRPVPDHGIASKPKFEAGNGSRSRTQTPDTTRNSARLARAPERAQPANPTRSHAS